MLKKRSGSDTGLILDLVSYLIIEEENAGQYYPDFAFTHPLPIILTHSVKQSA